MLAWKNAEWQRVFQWYDLAKAQLKTRMRDVLLGELVHITEIKFSAAKDTDGETDGTCRVFRCAKFSVTRM